MDTSKKKIAKWLLEIQKSTQPLLSREMKIKNPLQTYLKLKRLTLPNISEDAATSYKTV